MNRGRIIVLFLAVGCAGLAMLLMKNMVNTNGGAKRVIVNREVSEIQVLIAKGDIKLGAKVKAGDLKWQPWPKSASHGYIVKSSRPRAKSEYTGAIARVAIGKGDPIRASKLVKVNEGGVMAAILPSGQRALSIEISNAQGVSGLILPNDHVDLVLTIKGSRSAKRSATSETLLRNVRVLAIGETFETKNGQKSVKGKTATLALKSSQVEIVTQARKRGDLWLSLRSLADASGETGDDDIDTRGRNVVKVLKYGVASQVNGLK